MLQPLFKFTRDPQIDVLRGLALFFMIAANMVPSLLILPHPMLERVIGSMAAPLFVFLSGMVLSLAKYKPAHDFKHFFIRGMLLIFIGCLLDIFLYHFHPLVSMDVLYLIGFATFAIYPLTYINAWYRIVLAIFIFLITPGLQLIFGYHEVPLITTTPFNLNNFSTYMGHLVHTWLLEGYFPIFPWIGYSILGSAIGSLRWNARGTHYFNHVRFLVIALSLIIVGAITWITYPGPQYMRFGYSELFYPATWGFLTTSIGLIFFFLYFVDSFPRSKFYWPLELFGRSSLFIYIMHGILIAYVLDKLFSPQAIPMYLVLYVVLCSTLLVFAWVINKYRPQLRRAPFIVRFVLGA